jgi:hypothetical protein
VASRVEHQRVGQKRDGRTAWPSDDASFELAELLRVQARSLAELLLSQAPFSAIAALPIRGLLRVLRSPDVGFYQFGLVSRWCGARGRGPISALFAATIKEVTFCHCVQYGVSSRPLASSASPCLCSPDRRCRCRRRHRQWTSGPTASSDASSTTGVGGKVTPTTCNSSDQFQQWDPGPPAPDGIEISDRADHGFVVHPAVCTTAIGAEMYMNAPNQCAVDFWHG